MHYSHRLLNGCFILVVFVKRIYVNVEWPSLQLVVVYCNIVCNVIMFPTVCSVSSTPCYWLAAVRVSGERELCSSLTCSCSRSSNKVKHLEHASRQTSAAHKTRPTNSPILLPSTNCSTSAVRWQAPRHQLPSNNCPTYVTQYQRLSIICLPSHTQHHLPIISRGC